ncbi:hypothetical protein ACGC1H_005885 [Rhizoctonia solani]
MSAAVFYTFMAELKTQIDSAHPAPVHDFLAMLDDKGKLLRSYTQNIDGLEERAGLGTQDLNAAATGNVGQRTKNVQLHGDIHRVRCTLCSASYPCSPDHIAAFRTGTPPDCPECIARSDARTARSARALKCGTLRPAIVLYDEPHPLGDHIGAVQTSDLGKRPDLLIVMGTSLKVHGLRLLVKSFAKAVHSSRPSPSATSATSHSFLHNVIFVNRTPPPPGEWTSIIDYHIQGDTDTWVGHVLGEWKKSRPGDWEVQMSLDEVVAAKGGKLKDAKDKAKAKDSEALRGKGVKGKDTNIKVKAGKSKAKAPNSGSENQPPPSEDSSSKQRLVLTIRRTAKIAQSPLHTGGVKARKKKPALPGKGKAPLGTPTPMKTPARQASLATPAKSGDLPVPSLNPSVNPALDLTSFFTPMRPAQKRSAPSHSPFVSGAHSGQRRLDAMISMSPAHKRAAVSTPTPGSSFGTRVRSTSVVRSPGYVSGLLRGSKVASVSGRRMEGMAVSASETGTETTASETGALASASASDAGMDTTDVDDPSVPSVVSSRVDFILAHGDPSTQSSAYTSENEGVDQDITDGEDEAETEEAEESDGAEAEEENEEVAEETFTFSQVLDQVDSEDMVMDSPDEIPAMKNLKLPSGSMSKPVSRTSTSTQESNVSSQASRTSTQDSRLSSQSTQDSIFSRQGSQDTPASSQEDGPMAGSSQTITCPPSQTQLDLSQTISHSPPPSLAPSPKQDKSKRYLGNPRPPPFSRTKSVGDGAFVVQPMARHASMGSTSTRHVSNPRPTRSNSFARPIPRAASGNWTTHHAKSGARRPGARSVCIPIPGVDVGFSASGERFPITSSSGGNTDMDSDSSKDSEGTPLAQRCRVSITVPSPESGSSSRQSSEKRELGLILSPNMAPKDHEPRKRNRLKHGSDSEMDDDKEPHRGLLFPSLKGKEKESANEMVIDVDSMSDEDDGLDGAVGHMSLDGPSTDPDPDVDVVGMSSGAERTAITLSPIQTRARRRVKQAAEPPKRGKRAPPRSGTRTSSRLAAMASIS